MQHHLARHCFVKYLIDYFVTWTLYFYYLSIIAKKYKIVSTIITFQSCEILSHNIIDWYAVFSILISLQTHRSIKFNSFIGTWNTMSHTQPLVVFLTWGCFRSERPVVLKLCTSTNASKILRQNEYKSWGVVGSGFAPTGRLGPFCVEFVCSPHACMSFLRVLRLSPTIQRHAG